MEEENNITTNTPNTTNNEIDKLTLELFMNKKNYKKYLEKTDPKKYSDIQLHHNELEKYRGTILTMTDDLLENPNLQITTEINEIFDAYTKIIIRYLKHKEIENNLETCDEDVMFGTIDEEDNSESTHMKSYWSGEQVVKKSAKDISKFGVDMFLRSSR
jgi:phosphoribosylformylglycinamidine (FGAM) synthase PurS component